MIFNSTSLIITISSILIASQCVLLAVKSKDMSAKYFVTTMVLTLFWTIDLSMSASAPSLYYANLFIRVAHFLAIPICITFFNFAHYYYKKVRLGRFYTLRLLVYLLFYGLAFESDLIISSVNFNTTKNIWEWQIGSFYYIYFMIFTTLVISGLSYLYLQYKKEKDDTYKKSSFILFLSLTIGFILPIVTCFVLPFFGIYEFDWVGPSSAVIWIVFMCFAMNKYSLFNVRLLIFEILLILIWVIIFFHSILGTEIRGLVTELVLLIVIITLGILLLSSLKNAEKRKRNLEKIECDTRELFKKIEETLFPPPRNTLN